MSRLDEMNFGDRGIVLSLPDDKPVEYSNTAKNTCTTKDDDVVNNSYHADLHRTLEVGDSVRMGPNRAIGGCYIGVENNWDNHCWVEWEVAAQIEVAITHRHG